jgi:uncharacterized damage-inducible protein DinB
MNKAALTQAWDYFRTVNGVGLRAIAALPEDKLEATPIPGMRSPKALIIHQYQVLKDLAESAKTGTLVDSTPFEEAAAAKIHTRAELLTFCRACWDDADRTVAGLTDADLERIIKTPWGHDFPGSVMFRFVNDEYWHHRGQLYTFLRALGIAPPGLYSMSENDPAFQDKAKA